TSSSRTWMRIERTSSGTIAGDSSAHVDRASVRIVQDAVDEVRREGGAAATYALVAAQELLEPVAVRQEEHPQVRYARCGRGSSGRDERSGTVRDARARVGI